MHLFHKKLNITAEKLGKSDFDFYTSVITPWHLINVQAYISELAKNRKLKGLLIIDAHSKSGYCVKKENVNRLAGVDLTVLYDTEFKDFPINPSKNKKPFYLITPLIYQYELGRRIEQYGNRKVYLVKTDEGLMEYYDKDHIRMTKINDGIKKRMFLKALADKFVLMLCKIGWDKSQLTDRFLMKRNSEGIYEPQTSVVESVRNYLQLVSEPIAHKNERYCMFLSFLWDEYNMWDMKEYKSILTELKKVLNDIDIKLYIKPHPREKNLDKYKEWNIDIFENSDLPFETLLSNLNVKPVALIGLDSTALINASMIGNCISISLNHLVTRSLISESMQSGLEKFEKYFNGYVKFADSISDAQKLLEL